MSILYFNVVLLFQRKKILYEERLNMKATAFITTEKIWNGIFVELHTQSDTTITVMTTPNLIISINYYSFNRCLNQPYS